MSNFKCTYATINTLIFVLGIATGSIMHGHIHPHDVLLCLLLGIGFYVVQKFNLSKQFNGKRGSSNKVIRKH